MTTRVSIICEDGHRVTAFGAGVKTADAVKALESLGLKCTVANLPPSPAVMGGSLGQGAPTEPPRSKSATTQPTNPPKPIAITTQEA